MSTVTCRGIRVKKKQPTKTIYIYIYIYTYIYTYIYIYAYAFEQRKQTNINKTLKQPNHQLVKVGYQLYEHDTAVRSWAAGSPLSSLRACTATLNGSLWSDGLGDISAPGQTNHLGWRGRVCPPPPWQMKSLCKNEVVEARMLQPCLDKAYLDMIRPFGLIY